MSKKKSDLEFKNEVKQIEKEIKQYCEDHSHRRPITRRDFLNTGLISVGTSLMAPTITSLFSQTAWAKDLDYCGSGNPLPTFINLQLAGGPALFAQHLPRGKDGGNLSAYLRVGMNSDQPEEELVFKNNAPFWKKTNTTRGSGFLEGLKDRITKSTVSGMTGDALFNDITKKTLFVAVACRSEFDKPATDPKGNLHDLSGMLFAAGLGVGSLPYLLCETEAANLNQSTFGAGKLRFKDAILPAPTYLSARDPEAIKAAMQFKGKLSSGLSSDATETAKLQKNLITLLDDLGTHQAKAMLSNPNSSEARRTFLKLASCAAENNSKLFSQMDLSSVGIGSLSNCWPAYVANAEKDADSMDFNAKNSISNQIGSTVCTALRGLSGACTAIIGGYDYHTGSNFGKSRHGQHNHDIFYGEMIANILLTAKSLNKPVFLYLSTDGSVNSTLFTTSNNADMAWTGDTTEGMNYILAYDPQDKLESKDFNAKQGGVSIGEASFQINTYERETLGATSDIVVSNHPFSEIKDQDLAAAAVFLNYLEFSGRKDLLSSGPLVKVKERLVNSTNFDIFSYYGRMQKKS